MPSGHSAPPFRAAGFLFDDDQMGEVSANSLADPRQQQPTNNSNSNSYYYTSEQAAASSSDSITQQSSAGIGIPAEPISLPNPPLPNTYANRAANKASGALARFGKAIYGSTTSSAPTTPATLVSPISSGVGSPQGPPGVTGNKKDEIVFKARSEIIAMGPSPTENAVAIAGKDCKCVPVNAFFFFFFHWKVC